jgi:uncharacterized protein with HEPN domain
VPTLNGIVSVPSKHYREADCLQDIIDNIARIERHVEGLNQEGLAKDELRRNAVERCLERIWEAAFRLGDLAVVSMPAQPWKAIRGLGNRLRHAYDQIDISIVWNVVTDRHSELKTDAGAALERLRDPLIRIEPSGPDPDGSAFATFEVTPRVAPAGTNISWRREHMSSFVA